MQNECQERLRAFRWPDEPRRRHPHLNPASPLGRERFSSLPLPPPLFPFPLPWTWTGPVARCQSVLSGLRWRQECPSEPKMASKIARDSSTRLKIANIIYNDTCPAHPVFSDDASEWSAMATKLAVADRADSPWQGTEVIPRTEVTSARAVRPRAVWAKACHAVPLACTRGGTWNK